MRVLGIDPGLQKCGWGVVETDGNRLHFVACGLVKTMASLPLYARLAQIDEGLARIVTLHKPSVAAIEETFMNNNAASALKLGAARGAAIVSAARAGLEVHEYAANLVKKSVVGTGHAAKEQIGMMIRTLLPASGRVGADEADALAIAICHAHHAQSRGETQGMIAKLMGLLDSVAPDRLILNVNGVGYEVFASRRTLSNAGQPGDPLTLLIDTHVREDYIHLFGFMDAAEQQWFRLLTSVQGVGPRAGLAILSACPVERLGFAIASGDAALLRQAEGVGPKLATRIVTELKDKAAKIDLSIPATVKGKKKGAEAVAENVSGLDNDAVSALVNLGYQRTDAYSAVLQAKQKANDNSTLQDLIRLALKELSS